MTSPTEPAPANDFARQATEASIRIAALALLALWCFLIVRPFLTPLLWGIIISIAVYPGHVRLTSVFRGHHKLSAIVLTLLMLMLLVLPTIYLAGLLAENVQTFAGQLKTGKVALPPPPTGVKSWPLIGKPLAAFWQLASDNLEAALLQLAPQIKLIGGWVVSTAAGVGLTVLQFFLSVIVAGVLLAHSTAGGRVATAVSARLAGDRGPLFVELAEATIRSVARGVLGVALIQSLLAGAGLAFVGVPGSGLWALLCLILAVVQLGVAPIMLPAVIYVFSTSSTSTAILFLAWAIFVSVIDNILRPLLLGRGVDVPMFVILLGTIGGMLLSGIIGLFVGAVVLALGYTLFQAWIAVGSESAGGASLTVEGANE